MSEKKETVFIDPLSDFGCKKLFGPCSNPASLINFLNSILKLEHPIVKIEFISTEHLGELETDRKSVFDMHAIDEQRNYIIVEIQRGKQEFFKDRSIFYSSYPIRASAKKGKDWNYKLKKIYTVCLLDFSFDDTHPEKVVHNVKLIEQDTQTVFSDRLNYCYIEVKKFKKAVDQLLTREDQWLYVLKNLDNLQDIPVFLSDDPVFKSFFMDARTANLMENELMAYYAEMKQHWDRYAVMETAVNDGKKEGIKEGRKAGIEEGEINGKIKALIQFTSHTPEQIAQMLNLPVSYVLNILDGSQPTPIS